METLFLKLLNLSLTASWMVLAVLLVRMVFRKAPRWIYCLLWGLVGLRLVCPFSIESAFSLIPSAQPVPESILMSQVPHIQSGIGAIDAIVNPMLENTLTPNTAASVNPAQVWAFIFSVVWGIGLALILLYGVGSTAVLRYRLRTATKLRDNIRQSDQIEAPFVFGLFRPQVYVPYNIPEEDLPYVLAHEEAHIRRRDHWWKPLGFALLAVYWFNPLLWVAYVLLCRDIEAACDEKVIREMEEDARVGYSTALLRCSARPAILAACPLAFGEVGVKERIRRVMQYRKPAVVLVVLTLVVTVVAAVCLLTNPKEPTAGGENGPKRPSSMNEERPKDSTPGSESRPESADGLIAWVAPQAPEDIWNLPAEVSMELPELPGIVFHYDTASITATKPDGTAETLIQGMPIWSAYFQDINGDGIRELCAALSIGSGIVDDRILCWESTADTVYSLKARSLYDYSLRVQDNTLYADQRRYSDGSLMATGRLVLRDGVLGMERTDPDVLANMLLTPGNTFVSWECLYLSPLSSAIATGDSGYRYEIREDGFAKVPQAGWREPEGVLRYPEGEPLEKGDAADEGENYLIPVSDWSWQPFPWTEEEWADLAFTQSITGLLSQVQDLRYLPLDDSLFLLFADGDLLAVHTSTEPSGRMIVWSVYSLVYEEAMGTAVWLCPHQQTGDRWSAFSFQFEEGVPVFASCSDGQIIDFDSASAEQEAPVGMSLDFPADHLIWWDPRNADGTYAAHAAISFSYPGEDGKYCFGTLYLRSDGGDPLQEDVLYTAKVVGTGLHIESAALDNSPHAVLTYTPAH